MTLENAAATWARVKRFAASDVKAPTGGCVAAVPERTGLLVPLKPVPDAPVTQWLIGTDELDSGVPLGQLEGAMARLAQRRIPALGDEPPWAALARYLTPANDTVK